MDKQELIKQCNAYLEWLNTPSYGLGEPRLDAPFMADVARAMLAHLSTTGDEYQRGYMAGYRQRNSEENIVVTTEGARDGERYRAWRLMALTGMPDNIVNLVLKAKTEADYDKAIDQAIAATEGK